MVMMQKTRILGLILLVLMLLPAVFSHSQESVQEQYARRFQNGFQFYRLARFNEAAVEFRRAQESAVNTNDLSRALYWVILSQMALSDFGSAIRDIEELERIAPHSAYTIDMFYHRARVYYIQGYFEEALFLFNRYIESTSDINQEAADRRAAAFFWMGETLFAMGQFDEAEVFYAWVAGRYPDSPKVEAASYRIDLIKQRKIQAELLALLQWSHEESLRTSEDFQRTIRTYEHTLNMYQRRIAELLTVEETQSQIQEQQQIPDTLIPQSEGLMERAMQLERNIQEILRGQSAGGTR